MALSQRRRGEEAQGPNPHAGSTQGFLRACHPPKALEGRGSPHTHPNDGERSRACGGQTWTESGPATESCLGLSLGGTQQGWAGPMRQRTRSAAWCLQDAQCPKACGAATKGRTWPGVRSQLPCWPASGCSTHPMALWAGEGPAPKKSWPTCLLLTRERALPSPVALGTGY